MNATPSRLRRCALALALSAMTGAIHAAGDLSQQKPIELTVRLGDADNRLRFEPAEIALETGRLYRLRLTNPSHSKHYFSSPKFSASVFTRKVQINDAQGQAMAEVKGEIREIEVYPGHSAEWWFVPVKTGTLTDLHCPIPGHTEAGMVGRIVIR